MNTRDNITLNTMAQSANKDFVQVYDRLGKVESRFRTRMRGKTTLRLIGSLLGTLLWVAVLVAAVVMTGKQSLTTLTGDFGEYAAPVLWATVGITGLLLLIMIIDHLVNFSYYGKIASYAGAISRLKARVNTGRNAIKSQCDTFMDTQSKGWNYPLKAGTPVSEEATAIENRVSSMESLSNGFLHKVKNVLFALAVFLLTVLGCAVFFDTASDIIVLISDSQFSKGTLLVFNLIGLVLVCIVECILARLCWSGSDCSVSNVTLLILLAGPPMFLALMALVTLLVTLVVGLVSIVLSALAAIFGVLFVIGCLSGG